LKCLVSADFKTKIWGVWGENGNLANQYKVKFQKDTRN